MDTDFYNVLLDIDKLFQHPEIKNQYIQYISSKRHIDDYEQIIIYKQRDNAETKFIIQIYNPNYIECSIPIKKSNYSYITVFNYRDYNIHAVYEYIKYHLQIINNQ